MKKLILFISLFIIIIAPTYSDATESTHMLGVCLTDSMNGKERKSLAKWIFLAISTHDVIKPYSKASSSDIEQSNKSVGALITRLLTEDCPEQARLAHKENGSQAFDTAFRLVGEVAMQELMADPNVSQSIGAFEKYLDQDKFNKVFR